MDNYLAGLELQDCRALVDVLTPMPLSNHIDLDRGDEPPLPAEPSVEDP